MLRRKINRRARDRQPLALVDRHGRKLVADERPERGELPIGFDQDVLRGGQAVKPAREGFSEVVGIGRCLQGGAQD